jgi:hypothetical protein
MLNQMKGMCVCLRFAWSLAQSCRAGTLAEKKAFIAELKMQAQRFKKQSLISELENYEKVIL